jgi:hypothetical protein
MLEWNPSSTQFNFEGFLINGLKEASAESPIHLHRRTYDLINLFFEN